MDLARQAPANSLTDPRAEFQVGMDDIAIMGKAVEERRLALAREARRNAEPLNQPVSGPRFETLC